MADYTAIDNPEEYFQPVIWTGDGEDSRAISLSNTDANTDPDLVWIKIRTQAYSHSFFDSTRGVTQWLSPNETGTEESSPSQGFLTSFDTDGFTVEDGSSSPGLGNVNKDGDTYVAWCWKESATAGFDIVAYTGDGSARNISHSLSALPHRIIIKARDRSGPDWITFGDKIHTTPHDAIIKLNNTTALNTGLDSSWFNDTNPTTSVFTVGTQGDLNADGSTYMAYLWTSIQGFSKIGSYTGGSDPFVYLGFRPAMILFKNSGATENWRIIDNKRDPHNPAVAHIYPNLSNAEGSGASYSDYCDFLSNGFKIISGSGEVDGSGQTITYMAFAESPFVNSEGVPNNAR